MNISSIYLAKGVHTRLKADQAIKAVLGQPPRLYDQAPEDPIFPYLTYGPIREEDIGGDEAPIMQYTLSLHIWSRYAGRAETLSLMAIISDAVMRAPITLTSDSTLASGGGVQSQKLFVDVLPTTDRQGYHGILRFRFICCAAAEQVA